MIILYWMTPDPVTVTEDQSLMEISEILHSRNFRRLPVVRGGELCGIVGRTDLLRWIPTSEIGKPLSDSTRDVLSRARVREAMTPDPLTCEAYEHLEVVAERMRSTKVGAFPVMNRGHLVGIISEMDLLRALVELSHLGEGQRITIRIPIEQKIDILYQIVDLSRRSGLELLAVVTHPILDESATMATLRVKGARVESFVKHLWEAGYKVSDVS